MATSADRAPLPERIEKLTADRDGSNMPDLDKERARFSWTRERAAFARSPGGLNLGREAVDRAVAEGFGEQVAIRWLGRGEGRRQIDYRTLASDSDRFANALVVPGLARGERVFTLLGRVPELHVTALGTLKAGGVYCPLSTAFGPESIEARMRLGEARVLVTTRARYRRKIVPIRARLPALRMVVLLDGAGDTPAGCVDWDTLLADASGAAPLVDTSADDPALLFFTSGTTGPPRGVLHAHGALVAQRTSARLALDLRAGDTYWCTADPGWVSGTVYGVLAPLACRATLIVDAADFDPTRWYATLERERVNVWYTAPTAIRMLMQAGAALAQGRDLGALRFMASVGEPLNPAAVRWGDETFGMPFHDNWWQTETGAIMIANFASMDVRPGSMGKPLPGIEAAVLARKEGRVVPIDAPDTVGELALRSGWPSMMREYVGEPERYARRFEDGWYLSGDLARRDADGYYWFVGRDDDLIESAGQLIGPFEVESALMEHPAAPRRGALHGALHPRAH